MDHITDGGDPSSWFANPASQVSAHFTVLRDGVVKQHVRLGDQAWVNGVPEAALPAWMPPGFNPNTFTVGIEHEGKPLIDAMEGFGVLTATQFRASAALHRWLFATIDTLAHVGGHYMVSPISRANCPGKLFPWRQLGAAIGRTIPG